MPETKTYELFLPRICKITAFGMLGIFIIVCPLLIVLGVFFFPESDGRSLWILGVFMMVIMGWTCYWIFSFPHRITVSKAGEITFISVLRRRQVSVAEIESIKPDPSQFGVLEVRTQNKKIKILSQFDDFHDFILNLKVNNPSIELRGC